LFNLTPDQFNYLLDTRLKEGSHIFTSQHQ
jgi:hypothetical protein